jgi:hypothetical protein
VKSHVRRRRLVGHGVPRMTLMSLPMSSRKTSVSSSSPLVGFGELNDNTIKDLTSLRSVKQEIEFIA